MTVSTNESSNAAIRNAALELFSSVGFHGTGIRRIAEEAGVSLATLYHYMASKEDLLVEMMRGNILTLLREAELALQGVPTPPDRLRALVRVHITTHIQDRLLCIVADTELRSLSEGNRGLVVRYRDDYEALWKKVIESGLRAKDFTVADADVAAKALLDMCTGVVHWYSPEGRLDLDALVDLYTELCAQALGAHRARKRRVA